MRICGIEGCSYQNKLHCTREIHDRGMVSNHWASSGFGRAGPSLTIESPLPNRGNETPRSQASLISHGTVVFGLLNANMAYW